MVHVDAFACWIASSLFTAIGVVAACDAWNTLRSHKFKRLLWLLPIIFVSVWLTNALKTSSPLEI